MNIAALLPQDMPRQLGCWRSLAAGFTVWALMGHVWLSLEFSMAYLPVGVVAGLITAVVLEVVDAQLNNRQMRFQMDKEQRLAFFLPVYISSFNLSMLMYCAELLWPVALGAIIAIASKYAFRIWHPDGGFRSFMNPQAFGLCAIVFLVPEVGLVPPYEYFTQTGSPMEFIVALMGIFYGIVLNRKRKRLPMVVAFHTGFLIQALIRMALQPHFSWNPLLMMTGPAYLYVSMFLMPEIDTTPERKSLQILFGLSAAFFYAVIILSGYHYALFYAVMSACFLRGLLLSLGVKYV